MCHIFQNDTTINKKTDINHYRKNDTSETQIKFIIEVFHFVALF